jgi:ribonuclease Z
VLVTFLGTSSAVPTRHRNVTSLTLGLEGRREVWLFDCGEGTQHQLLRSPVKTGQLRRVFVTHMHGDHVFGLPGLLTTLSLGGGPARLDLHGPEGLEEFVRGAFERTFTNLSFPVAFHVVSPGTVLEDAGWRVTCAALRHVVPAFGYRVDEPAKPGSLDAPRAASLGIPFGPLLGRLKAGEDVALPGGLVVRAEGLLGPPRPGRSFAFCTDTTFCDGAISLARDVDLLVHETTYAAGEAGLAAERLHATPAMAAEVARRAGARRLLITHFSSRYLDPAPLVAEARAIFPPTEAAEDMMVVEVPRREAGNGGPSPSGGISDRR